MNTLERKRATYSTEMLELASTDEDGPSGGEKSEDKCCASCCRPIGRFLCSQFGLSALLLCYCFMGAFLFNALEAPHHQLKVLQVHNLRDFTVARVWNITENTNVLYKKKWFALVNEEMSQFQKQLIQAVKQGFDGHLDDPPDPTHKETKLASSTSPISPGGWSIPESFLYSLTLITTIGEFWPQMCFELVKMNH